MRSDADLAVPDTATLRTFANLVNGLMRIPMLALATAVSGCAQHPTDAEKELAAYVEQHVVLPKGSPGPQCYKRYYRIVEGAELAELFPSLGKSGKRLLIGHYFRHRPDGAPVIVWLGSGEEVPKIHDAGCSVIGVYYVAGEAPESISATCSFNIAGEIPEEVEPFSC